MSDAVRSARVAQPRKTRYGARMRNFYVNASIAGERRTEGPMVAADALRKAVTLRTEGAVLITLTDEATGLEVDIERFMRGNPSEIQ